MARQRLEETLLLEEFIGGTPHFVSPEYIKSSRDLDIRSDIYSLGMTLYHITTGTYPFPECSDAELIHHHLETPPTPLAQTRGDLSPAFCELVDSMLAKRREDRPSLETLLAKLAAMVG
jgi:serine/threonine-protein kinase